MRGVPGSQRWAHTLRNQVLSHLKLKLKLMRQFKEILPFLLGILIIRNSKQKGKLWWRSGEESAQQPRLKTGKDYQNHNANYGKPDSLAEGQGRGRMHGVEGRRNFRKLENFNNFGCQGLQLDTELFLPYCKPWEQKQIKLLWSILAAFLSQAPKTKKKMKHFRVVFWWRAPIGAPFLNTRGSNT